MLKHNRAARAAADRILLAWSISLPLMAANYTAQRLTIDGVEVVRLGDAAHKVRVTLVPSFGNNVCEIQVNGKNILWTPVESPAEMKRQPRHLGNPFLAPWANRLDRDGFFANGKQYSLDPAVKNFGRDSFGQPLHGLLTFSPLWEVVEARGGEDAARVVSRLEFWKYPDLMAQFPFAHTIEIAYELRDGAVEVATTIRNHSREPMPVSNGFHPYFRIHDAPRDQWRVTLPVREHLTLSSKLIPTGETTPAGGLGQPFVLAGRELDDVFSGLVAGEGGGTTFSVEGAREKISVIFGPEYPVAVAYAPAGRDFICFEPMTGPTNAFNLAHAGLYKNLQTIAPGGEWKASFRIAASGF